MSDSESHVLALMMIEHLKTQFTCCKHRLYEPSTFILSSYHHSYGGCAVMITHVMVTNPKA